MAFQREDHALTATRTAPMGWLAAGPADGLSALTPTNGT